MGHAEEDSKDKDSTKFYRIAVITYVTKGVVYTTNPFSSNKKSRLRHDPKKLEVRGYIPSKGVKICVTQD